MHWAITRFVLMPALLATSSCGLFNRSPDPTTRLDPTSAEQRNEWKASLFTPSALAGAMQVRGTAQWSRTGDTASTVNVTISNATAGGVHPWHVHRGRCGENGPIVGSAAAYSPLSVDNQGNASASAQLDMTLPQSGDYYVNVHASSANLGTIISCGNLAPPVS
jgi:hypothetical protein